ncbi:MAG: NAD(P)(+) transhydrogenase (Re/Si-specific) subunit beta [Bacteroidia bacterium]|nr:NAD(P)(+) transhydrogenase (Re/Si-specific) subunit beta [Bacteroidia bacterium]MBT8268131.1 NAD(P)(+) transhydrogenase (Re/Si-specific) subunit beta [Bacteroidia bacterium]NNF81488.1 NAD(P)(+) transhydrogenase (Re/Si-specific) subunit beta [Flavobacteriaceae bacterium]NNK71482.1 NAD(P)(+) transhydrogenase (Re/Si-specific) subunit beta [Flavobacteriaceae bacterium]NNL81656.1 NAD(P)(+) transhydrogenase (Re/Si-specific) subunit beta [Flavobacteriaceae bacterium]
MNIYLSIIYLVSTITFITGLKLLGHPETAKKGNQIAASGMGLAIVGTILLHELEVPGFIYGLIAAAIAIGAIIGYVIAVKVKMTKMPELVSLFNGFGGASAALIGLVEFGQTSGAISQVVTIVAAISIGSLTFSGSMIAWAKLNGTMWKDIRLPHYNLINNVIFLGLILFAAYIVWSGASGIIIVSLLCLIGLLYGVLLVIPIGGADMPVVISLLNSLTGIAAAITGILYDNMVMLAGGILVGSAGLILTFAMCDAMNRSLINVMFGAFGGGAVAEGDDSHAQTGGTIKKATVSDVAILMNYAARVIFVPGYGLAVAQAQHAIHELEQLLENRGIEVKYAIHPVAGRMPGHMNVLLAETNVEYDKLAEMEDVNPEFQNTDVVLVVGANDVVNPAARHDTASPIFGMPILDVDHAKQIIVNKRTMNPGYAGIDNELFYNQKTSMLFGDAKSIIQALITELKGM